MRRGGVTMVTIVSSYPGGEAERGGVPLMGKEGGLHGWDDWPCGT